MRNGDNQVRLGNSVGKHSESSGTHVEYPDVCAHQLFEQQVERSPDAVAVTHNERQLTYRELNQRANQLAHFLCARGIGPDQLVGICLERNPQLVISLLGVWKAGGAYVPLDPAYPPDRLSFMVKDAAMSVLLTEKKHADRFASAGTSIVYLDDDWVAIGRQRAENPNVVTSPSNLAYVMYTSGSTGQPKGAMIVHSGLVNYLSWAINTYEVEPGGSVPVHSSIAFDLTVTSLYPALLAGAQVELLAEDVGAQNLLAALRERKNRCLVKITPAHLDVLTHQLRADEFAGLTKTFVIGGENLSAQSVSLWRERAPNTRLINEYGPTETVVGCCIHEVTPSDPHSGSVPIGRPIANTQLYVLNDDRQPVPVGTMGELYIGGAGVARGYLDRPELTHERFLPDRFSGRAGALLYKTGDLVRSRPDGVLEFLGRVDDQVKVRGYRIELGEIEAAVASHPAVQSSAVLARDDGSGNKQLVGYVVVRDGHQLSSEIAQEFLKRQLPEYMVPAHFVFLESLPLTINGKVDRRALSALSEARDQSARNVVAPRNAIELAIASIWAELLKVETISVEDDFFDLGGHSLLAIRVLAQIRDRLDVDLDTQALFENSTLESLATLVAEAKGETPEVIRIPSRHDDDTLVASFAQEPLWILDQLVPNSPAYNIVDFIPFVGSVDVHALTKSLHELLVRHEVLRTAFERIDGQLMQIISPSCELDLTEIDLRSAPESELQNEWLKAVHEQGRKVFDLAKAPLVRACMVRVSATEHRLLIVIHHIIADEWSMEVIQEELRALYAAHSTGRLSPLRPLAIQYADYALWQRAWLQGAVLEDQIEYWKSELKGAMPVLALPTDKPRPASPTFRGACELFTISKATLASLQSLARREQATPFMLLEAAFASLLYRYTGQDDILIGTPISGRKYTETQGLVGCFLNSVVLRNQFSDATTFTELLRQVRVRALGAHAHSDLPFERLVVELSPERDQGRTPLFQVMFILHSRDGVSQVSKVSGNYELETGTSKFDLSLVLSESEVGIEGLIEYSTGLFQSDTIRRLSRSYVRLLEEVVSNPERSIARIPMVADLDREQLVVEWNRTSLEFDESNLCLHEMISLHAAKTPDRIALVFEGQEMSYSQLEQRSNQLANYLIGLGVVPDMLVGLLVERSLDMVVGLLGILKAGGAYVPLDPSFPPDRLGYVIEDAQMRVVITHRGLDATQKILPETVVHLDRDWEMIAKATGAASLSNKPNLESLAYVLYTSGSTGMPKGVAIPHAAIVNFLASMRNEPGMRASDVLLAITTLSFDIAGLELYLPLISGAKVVIASRDEVIDPDRLAKKLGDCGCTYLQATPATWRALIDAGWEGSTNLKALCGGEAMPPDLAQALLSRCAELWNM